MSFESASWAHTQRAFAQAGSWFVSTAAAAEGRWEENALGIWSVRDLVGHTSRAFLTVEAYLDGPATRVEVGSPVDYFRLVSAGSRDPAAVARRGREAGAGLGDRPAAAVEEIAQRVLSRVLDVDGDALVSTPVGGMRLSDYLPTRTFELTVHTCDLATALGRPVTVPGAAATASLTLLGGLADRAGLAGPLLLAGTGRGPLPGGFSVL